MISQAIIRALHKIIDVVEEMELGYAIFGGIALQAWKRFRSTLDIDIMIIVNKIEINTLISKLCGYGFKSDKKGVVELQGTSLFRLSYFDNESSLDIKIDIAVADGIFQKQVVNRAIKTNVFGKTIRFVTCEDLIILKLLSGRPIDLLDAEELIHLNKSTIDKSYLKDQISRLNIRTQLKDITMDMKNKKG